MDVVRTDDGRARAAGPAPTELPLQCLLFLLGEEAFALDISSVREIGPWVRSMRARGFRGVACSGMKRSYTSLTRGPSIRLARPCAVLLL